MTKYSGDGYLNYPEMNERGTEEAGGKYQQSTVAYISGTVIVESIILLC